MSSVNKAMTKEDAKAALEAFNNEYVEVIPSPPLTCAAIVGEKHAQTIITALDAMAGDGFDDKR